jgi:hypothetical protein
MFRIPCGVILLEISLDYIIGINGEDLQMKLIEIVAWYGAFIATLVLLWDIYKWKRSGPIINVSISPDMELISNVPDRLKGKILIFVQVVNSGNMDTTLTHLVIFHYSSFFKKIIKKKNMQAIVVSALYTPLPYVLESGKIWQGGILQDKKLEEMSRNGYLYCGIIHASRKKPILQRVIVPTKIPLNKSTNMSSKKNYTHS